MIRTAFRKLALPAFAALVAGSIAAIAANTTIFTSIGDQIFYGPLGSTYTKAVPVTGFSSTFAASQGDMIMAPAGTLAAGYVTMAPSPVPDGRKACVFSTQEITLLYWSANTGQTMNNAVTTLAANARNCYLYSLSNKTWDRSQ